MINNHESIIIDSQDILNCRFDSWYSKFQSFSFPTEIIELSDEVVESLKQDCVKALSTTPASSQLSGWSNPTSSSSSSSTIMDFARESGLEIRSYSSDSDSDTEQREDTEAAASSPLHCPLLNQRIDAAIARFDGEVFPKCSWSAPSDAAWISPHKTLKCCDAEQVLLLLQASDRVMHDLTAAYDGCSAPPPTRHVLVLRQWYKLNLGMEFRCFVRDRQLVALSQRHDDIFFDFLASSQSAFRAVLSSFLASHVLQQFPSPSFVVDLYLDQRDRVWIIDFNPWSPSITSPALFTWNELQHFPFSSDPPFRVLEHPAQIRPPKKSPILDLSALEMK